MWVLGIDVGLTGAIVLVGGECKSLRMIEDMPTRLEGREKRRELDLDALAKLFEEAREYKPDFVVIEAQGPAPGQGLASTFKLARQFGQIEGLAHGMGFRVELVRPHVWKAALRLGSDKERSRTAARKLWPRVTYFDRVKDHGRAEAALLAHWGILAHARDAA